MLPSNAKGVFILNINIISVGKLKEKYLTAALDEYIKRISRFAKVCITEIADKKIPENASEKEQLQVLRAEGDMILSKIKDSHFVFALCVEGTQLNSVEFSKKISLAALNGKNDIDFIIGGSLGLCQAVKDAADFKISFSEMTFPHQLMRVILAEQIYRSFKIINNETYHK